MFSPCGLSDNCYSFRFLARRRLCAWIFDAPIDHKFIAPQTKAYSGLLFLKNYNEFILFSNAKTNANGMAKHRPHLVIMMSWQLELRQWWDEDYVEQAMRGQGKKILGRYMDKYESSAKYVPTQKNTGSFQLY